MMNFRHIAFTVLAAVTLSPAMPAKHAKIAKDLDESGDPKTVDVIVRFTAAPGASHDKKITDKGGSAKQKLQLVKSGVYSISTGKLAELAGDPSVEYISPDRPVQATMDTFGPAVYADIAQSYGWTGKGIGVAVIDSGVSSPPDLVKQLVYSKSFNGFKTDEIYGHGTHVAGIINGIGKDSAKQYTGIAPEASIINFRVLDDNGAGTDSAVIAAIQEAIAQKSKYNIRVINLSVGRPVRESYKTDPLCQAVEQAWKAGIVVVVAAGNNGRDNSFGTDGYGTINSPANDPYVITVGAFKTGDSSGRGDDRIASYSSKGPTVIDQFVKPDLVAPGNRIISVSTKGTSLLEKASPENKIGAAYFKLSGTSMAAPMVSGTVALMLQKDPSLTPDLVKARLMRTATKAASFPTYATATDPVTATNFTTRHDVFSLGAGYLDVWAALSDSSTATAGKPALSPKAVRNSLTGVVSLSILWGESVLWGDSILWGESVIWGSGAFVSGSTILWGDSVVWNNTASAGNSVLWGDKAPVSTAAPQGAATSIAFNGEN